MQNSNTRNGFFGRQRRLFFILHALTFLGVFIPLAFINRVLLVRFGLIFGVWAILLAAHAVIFYVLEERARLTKPKNDEAEAFFEEDDIDAPEDERVYYVMGDDGELVQRS